MGNRKQRAEDMIRRYAGEKRSNEAEIADVQRGNQAERAFLLWIREQVGNVVSVALERLTIKDNVRFMVDAEAPEFAGLVADIRAHGVEQNILVDLRETGGDGFELVVLAGQRRVLGARAAGLKKIDARIVKLEQRAERLARGLAENLHRKDLHSLERAEVYQALIDEGWSDTQIGEYYRLEPKTIQIFRRLANYPLEAKDVIKRHPKKFSARLLFSQFLGKKWERTEDLLQALKIVAGEEKTISAPPTRIAADLKKLSGRITKSYKLQCKVQGNAEKGSLTINYQTPQELQQLLKIFQA